MLTAVCNNKQHVIFCDNFLQATSFCDLAAKGVKACDTIIENGTGRCPLIANEGCKKSSPEDLAISVQMAMLFV